VGFCAVVSLTVLGCGPETAGTREKEQYKALATYRDHSYGHSPTYQEYGKNDPSVWKGIAIYASVTIKHIKYVEKDK
jgi:hypothetical protein